MADLIHFEWEKCPDGYSIKRLDPEFVIFTDDGPSKQIVSPSPSAPEWVRRFLPGLSGPERYEHCYLVPNSSEVIKCNPLEDNKAAFLEFAYSYQSPEDVIAFVSKYGLLGHATLSNGTTWLENHLEAKFISEAGFMMDTVSWLGLAEEDRDFGSIIAAFNSAEPFRRKNDHNQDAAGFVQLQLKLRASPSGGNPELQLVPQDLSEALWLQYALAVTGGEYFRECDECSSWFVANSRKGINEKRYCSNACSMRSYRKRKKAVN